MSILEFKLTGSERLTEMLRSAPQRLTEILSVKLRALMFLLAGKIQAEKLTGQVLKVRTGILRGSVHADPVRTEGPIIIGTVGAANPPATYGALHETGVPHSWAIHATRARALSFLVASQAKAIARVTVRHPALPARPFMEPSLAENAETIRAALQAAVDTEISKP